MNLVVPSGIQLKEIIYISVFDYKRSGRTKMVFNLYKKGYMEFETKWALVKAPLPGSSLGICQGCIVVVHHLDKK